MSPAAITRSDDPFVAAARQAIRKAGWDPYADLEILAPQGPESPAAPCGRPAGRVRLVSSPELLRRVTQAMQLLGVAHSNVSMDILSEVVASRVYMQVGSFKVCPSSAYDYAEILEASADGMRSAGAPEPDVHRYMVPMASLFIAAVVCGTYGMVGPDPAATRRGWCMDQIVWSLAENVSLPTFTTVCANVQLRLWSDAPDLAAALRGRFPASFDVLDFETDRGVAILLDSFEHTGTSDGLAWSGDSFRDWIVDELMYNWRAWPLKAFQWAEMLTPYVCDQQSPPPPPPSETGRHAPRERPSDLARHRRAAIQSPGPPNTRLIVQTGAIGFQQLPAMPFDPFADRLRSDPSFLQSLIQSGIGRGKNPLDYYPNLDALDALYRSRATQVRVEAPITSRPGMGLEVAHLTREEVGNGLPELSRVDWGATRFGPDGELRLYHKALPILLDEAPAGADSCGFPDLLFCVDSSGSMKWDPVAGAGPYDALLRAIFSVLEFLENRRKAPFMRFAVVNFSGTTCRTSWNNYSGLREIKKALFQWQGGGTVLDCSILEQVAETSADRFLCLVVTDSQIKNADAVLGVLGRMVQHGHGVVLIHIGTSAPICRRTQALGIAVHVIADPSQLQGLCLDYARRNYGR